MSAEPRFANIIQILYNMNIYGMSAEPRFANIIQILYNMNIYEGRVSRTEVREHNTNTLQYEYLWYVAEPRFCKHNTKYSSLANINIQYGM
jgi:hypothetical protein